MGNKPYRCRKGMIWLVPCKSWHSERDEFTYMKMFSFTIGKWRATKKKRIRNASSFYSIPCYTLSANCFSAWNKLVCRRVTWFNVAQNRANSIAHLARFRFLWTMRIIRWFLKHRHCDWPRCRERAVAGAVLGMVQFILMYKRHINKVYGFDINR